MRENENSQNNLEDCRRENGYLLRGIGFASHEFIFTGSVQAEFRMLLERSKRGEIDGWRLVDFMNGNRELFTKLITFWGIGYIIDQDTKNMEMIKGQKRDEVVALIRAVNVAKDNVLNGSGIATYHIIKRGEDGQMEPIYDPILFKNVITDTDLVKEYLNALSRLFRYYESFFSSDDIVWYCRTRIDKINAGLASGESRGRELTDEDIEQEQFRIKGLQEAISRHSGGGLLSEDLDFDNNFGMPRRSVGARIILEGWHVDNGVYVHAG